MNKIYKIILCSMLLVTNYMYGEDYVMQNVVIEASGDPFSARNRALSEGQRTSLTQLIDKLSASKMTLPKLTDDEISSMVKDFEFLSEKMTSTNYKAMVNFSYDKDAIDKLLGNSKSDVKNEDTDKNYKLIIPIFIRGTQTIIWQDYNYWGIAIDKQITKLSLSEQYVMPLGELDDIEILSDEAMAKGDYQQLYPIISKYHANQVIIALAHYFIDPKTNYPTIILNLRYVSKDGQKTSEKIFPFKEGGSLHDLLAKAAEELLNSKASDALTTKANQSKHDNFINVSVLIKKFDDLIYIKQKLIDLCGENNLKTIELSPTKAQLKINTAGVLGDIVHLLENVKIKVQKTGADLILSR